MVAKIKKTKISELARFRTKLTSCTCGFLPAAAADRRQFFCSVPQQSPSGAVAPAVPIPCPGRGSSHKRLDLYPGLSLLLFVASHCKKFTPKLKPFGNLVYSFFFFLLLLVDIFVS